MKSSFLYLFWEWVRLYMGNGPMSLLDFMEWLGSSWGVVAGFCVFALSCSLVALYTLYILF